MADETEIGGRRQAFPTTLWSSILRAADPDSETRRGTLEKLLRTYWKPVYCCVRYGWNKSPEDAKDLVQGFFLNLLERDSLLGLDPAKGTFRSFLKTALKNFLLNERRDAARLKRGAGISMLPLEEVDKLQAAPGEPHDVFDSEWIRCVFEESVGELRKALCAEAKEKYFRVFERYDLDSTQPTYRSIAEEIGLTESDVRNYLHHARRTLRQIIIRTVSQYALDENDAEEELRWILGGPGRR